jgi:hypothetical protein
MADNGILERQASDPIATACLLVSFFALVFAVGFQVVEVGEIRDSQAGSQEARLVEQADLKGFSDRVDGLVLENQKLVAGESAGEGEGGLDAADGGLDALDPLEDTGTEGGESGPEESAVEGEGDSDLELELDLDLDDLDTEN